MPLGHRLTHPDVVLWNTKEVKYYEKKRKRMGSNVVGFPQKKKKSYWFGTT